MDDEWIVIAVNAVISRTRCSSCGRRLRVAFVLQNRVTLEKRLCGVTCASRRAVAWGKRYRQALRGPRVRRVVPWHKLVKRAKVGV